MVYYVFLIRVCDDHSATWHFYFIVEILSIDIILQT